MPIDYCFIELQCHPELSNGREHIFFQKLGFDFKAQGAGAKYSSHFSSAFFGIYGLERLPGQNEDPAKIGKKSKTLPFRAFQCPREKHKKSRIRCFFEPSPLTPVFSVNHQAAAH